METLADSYTSSEIVALRNLRLPELDNNRNVDQQKALIFGADSCRYDVIIGAYFLSKTGIDVKYMGTHCQIHGDTFHISKYMGIHFQIHGETLPNIWGHVANTKYMYNIHGENIYGISLITMHGMRAGVHSTLGSSPGNLVFNRDMFLNIPLIADWHAITQI